MITESDDEMRAFVRELFANTDQAPRDIVARAKWDAWSVHKGVSADDAKQKYIDLIESLRSA